MVKLAVAAAVLLAVLCNCSCTKLVLNRAARFNQKIVGEFNLSGDLNFAAIYYTKIHLGSPPQEFHVQIDSGSNLLWVNGISCATCPVKTTLDIDLHFYNSSNSSTSSNVWCSETKACVYGVTYGDGSKTVGELVTDFLHIHPATGARSSFNVTFGCSTKITGLLQDTIAPVDGILGLGQGEDSVLTQLSSRGIIPQVFSHCLRGDDVGGGILVLGEIVHPSTVFSPLIQHQPHYNLQLLSISVAGQTLPIDSESLKTKHEEGIIIDSGTTLAYLAKDIYDPFITAVNTYVSNQVKPHPVGEFLCYHTATSGANFFPGVILSFSDNADMVLKPEEYLFQIGGEWCMGFLKVPNGELSVLGELVLRDKIVVYDIYKQRVGWTTRINCSSSVEINSTYGFTNHGWSNCQKHNTIVTILITSVLLIFM